MWNTVHVYTHKRVNVTHIRTLNLYACVYVCVHAWCLRGCVREHNHRLSYYIESKIAIITGQNRFQSTGNGGTHNSVDALVDDAKSTGLPADKQDGSSSRSKEHLPVDIKNGSLSKHGEHLPVDTKNGALSNPDEHLPVANENGPSSNCSKHLPVDIEHGASPNRDEHLPVDTEKRPSSGDIEKRDSQETDARQTTSGCPTAHSDLSTAERGGEASRQQTDRPRPQREENNGALRWVLCDQSY